jgi:hypothetical protein
MLVVSEAMARAALLRKESRGGHAREDFPTMDKDALSKVNVVAQNASTGWQVEEVAHPDPPAEIQSSPRGGLSVSSEGDPARVPRRQRAAASSGRTRSRRTRAWSCSTRARHPGQAVAELAVRWNCKAGRCGSCSAEVNGKPRLMCMTRMTTSPRGSRSPSRR